MSTERKIIYGKNPVKEAIEASQPLTKIFIAHGLFKSSADVLKELAKKRNVPIREVPRAKLTTLVGHDRHQGIVALISSAEYGSIDDVFCHARQKNEPPLIALLDEIQDPHNFGAIIRSAEAFGIHGIIIPKDRSVGITDAVAKTSAGAFAHVIVARVINLAQTMEQLKREGLWLVAADQNAISQIDEVDYKQPLGVVIGSEGKGVRRLIKEKCDFLVRIPMVGKINSLNTSVAAAILFWEIQRQRKNKGSF